MIGETLSHFKIIDKLGEGGMGEVWRAEDTKLGREVALKVLPELFSQDAERMARFAREAQVLASLNHPNIASIYGLEEAGERRALVMELVEGETLAERIGRGAVPLEEALKLALQVAAALEEAHERGIIHRDLKPANVKVTPKGQVKVLDFGLAKALEGDPATSGSGAALTQSPTLTAQMTGAGVLLGTAAYMSPEQARGETADRRADIWAFGVVLMELLTGKTVYAGRTISDTLASVLAREPQWQELPARTPRTIRRLLERCLEKESSVRLQAIGEARLMIEGFLADPTAAERELEATAEALPAWRRHLTWAALALAVVAGVAAVAGWLRPAQHRQLDVMRLSVEIGGGDSILTQIGSSVVLSPDGSKLAYVLGDAAERSLFVRSLDQLEGINVSGSELAYLPFFSPDGEWVAFVTPGELKRVSVSGGTPLKIADVNFARGASWSPDGSIIYSPEQEGGLFRIPATGGEPEELTKPDAEKKEVTHRWPEVLPGGKAVLFVVHLENGNFADAVIEVLDLETMARKALVRGGTYPRYASSGHLLYARESTLYAVPFDLDRLEVTGQAAPLVEDLTTNEEAYGSAHYSISLEGRLAYLTGAATSAERAIAKVNRQGGAQPLVERLGAYWTPAFSPDGRQLAFGLETRPGDGDIWVEDLGRRVSARLTFGEADEFRPIWSPDGEWIYFASQERGGPSNIYRVASDGSGQPEPVLEGENDQEPNAVSPDGVTLIYQEQHPDSNWDLWSFSLDAEAEPELFLSTPFIEYSAGFSPDGRWLTYGSNESGSWEIYVRPFPVARGEWKVSSLPRSLYPLWRADGREILFRTLQGIASVEVDISGDTFRPGQEQQLFQGQFVDLFPSRDWTVAPDGETFVLFQSAETGSDSSHMILVTDWFAELAGTFAH